MQNLLRFYFCCSLILFSVLNLTGCGGGYGESTNGYLSENRANARNMLSEGTGISATATPNPNSLDPVLLAAGANFYEQQCEGCHGNNGQGSIPLINCGACSSLSILSKRIFDTMPPAGSTCNHECAEATAYYILAGFPNLNSVTPTPAPTATPTVSARTRTPTPRSGGISAKPIALISPLNEVIGFASYTATFSSSGSTDDTGITRTQWYVNNIEQNQASNFTYTLATIGRYAIKLVVTDQDGQTSESKVIVDVVSNGQSTQACDSGNVYMAKKLWTPLFNTCLTCHKAGGLASGSRLVLFTPNDKFYLSKNYDRISNLLLGGSNLIRDRAQGNNHAGGVIVPASDTALYADLAELQRRVITPPAACPSP